MDPGNIHKLNARKIKLSRKPRKIANRAKTVPLTLLQLLQSDDPGKVREILQKERREKEVVETQPELDEVLLV